MSELQKNYRIKKKIAEDTFEVPKKLMARLSEAGDTELKIFLYMASLGKDAYVTEEQIISELEGIGVAAESIPEGFAFLRGAGLIEKCTAKKIEKTEKAADEKPSATESKPSEEHAASPSSRPSYTSMRLAEEAEKGDFKILVDWTSARLGKVLNTSDMSMLFSFIDYLCLPQDVVMLAIEHCVSEGKPSLRYVEKLLIDFADKEINTYQRAEQYILSRKAYRTFEARIRRLFGMGDRALTARERSIVGAWQEWQMSDELIVNAYEKTVNNTKKASLSYMNKILENWHNTGVKAVGDIEKGAAKPDSGTSTFTPDDFFKIAVESSKK